MLIIKWRFRWWFAIDTRTLLAITIRQILARTNLCTAKQKNLVDEDDNDTSHIVVNKIIFMIIIICSGDGVKKMASLRPTL